MRGWLSTPLALALLVLVSSAASALDATALLESIRKGTEHSNAQRKLMGHPPMHVVGWIEKPHYDTLHKRLVWALSGRADGADHEVVNFNTRVLGRPGLISVVLVTDKESFERDRAVVPELIGGISFKPGKRYEEFVKGKDKVAEYGLAALVAGGAGVAVVKAAQMGLFARFWKVFVLGGIAALGGLWKWLTGRGKSENPATA